MKILEKRALLQNSLPGIRTEELKKNLNNTRYRVANHIIDLTMIVIG